MNRVLSIVTAALTGFAGQTCAQQIPVVVELYTSQGCSSCPPADAILRELNGHEGVIAIALHVDYWDYIGWKDEFGDPAHADRQRAYAANAGRRSVYTPEMVVNGQTDIVGAKPMILSKAIVDHMQTPQRMTLEVARDAATVRVRGSVPTGIVVPMEIHVLQVTPVQSTTITRGENRGNTFEYTNIAHDWRVVGIWDGSAPLDLSLEVSGADPVVVLVQEAGAGPIVAAARRD
jgi:hypothetical protein